MSIKRVLLYSDILLLVEIHFELIATNASANREVQVCYKILLVEREREHACVCVCVCNEYGSLTTKYIVEKMPIVK